ncbi:hypothetical protein HME9304_01960 [Flagellimonas maritima]|uniref:Endonuclease/exonuclease/phosphatase domain-containing protein n=1 Tax=Flagellimonas maritima TaxID=1383885 RepID=A0A2Z4LTT0_9FLAO|nr:endonuclease/exonuclease/phosphatase family protein [Allomuricauda aurantiaca]AWX44954.1 hypothetical protein HME9304_01960 [Allomuricauda aurantiaca]
MIDFLKLSISFLAIMASTACKCQELTLMTYNIRLDVASDKKNAWPNRKEMLANQILLFSPDVLGVQEARPNQVKDLSTHLTEYKNIGLGRDGENNGEHTAIYYNHNRLHLKSHGTFWLSDTPFEVSIGWDAAYPRICTYGLFEDKDSKKNFWVFNTHLDHKGKNAQLYGMQKILDNIHDLNEQNYPVILMGDFNVVPESRLIQDLKGTMNDSKELARIKFGSIGTFNGFNILEKATRRIDYIMFSMHSNLKIETYGTFSTLIDQRYLSDHFPVFVKFQIN